MVSIDAALSLSEARIVLSNLQWPEVSHTQGLEIDVEQQIDDFTKRFPFAGIQTRAVSVTILAMYLEATYDHWL